MSAPIVGIAQENGTQIHLWENGAPGFEHLKDEPEQAKDWWVKNVHNPSITVFMPNAEKSTGAAVLICPGGGHKELVFDEEGTKTAKFLNELGIAAFVLKYRLAREKDSPYTIEVHPVEDANRAMRLIRSKAQEWNIDPDRLGIMGFSAGGEVVSMVAYVSGKGDRNAPDPIDQLSAKPNFQILIYPGPLGVPAEVPRDAPSAFMLAANDDACCSEPIVKLLSGYRMVERPIEVHLYSHGGHGFNMGDRSDLATLSRWPQRLADWFEDSGLLDK